jgi:hypothetical protein
MSSETVSGDRVWQAVVAKGSEVFRLERRLPEVVHRLGCGARPFFDGDVVFGPSGWSMLASLATIHGDSVVHFLTVDPPAKYFLESIGRYGAFTTEATSDQDGYAEGLLGASVEAAPGKIAYVAEVAALFGDTGRWGIWVERGLGGLVSVDDPSRIHHWELTNGPFLSVEEALGDFLALNLAHGAEAEAFARRLRRNYSAFGDNG